VIPKKSCSGVRFRASLLDEAAIVAQPRDAVPPADGYNAGVSIFYGEQEPPEGLRSVVASYWVFRVAGDLPPGFEHSVPPDGAVSLAYGRRSRRGVLVGPRTEPFRPDVRPGDQVRGVRFWPGAARAVLGVEIRRFRNAMVPLDDAGRPDLAARLATALEDCEDDGRAASRFDEILGDR
jgi:hypothetical protein